MKRVNESVTAWTVDILKGGDSMTAIIIVISILGAIKLTDMLIALDK